MKSYEVTVNPQLGKEEQLAWKFATVAAVTVAADAVTVDASVAGVIVNRVIDNTSVCMRSGQHGRTRPRASARLEQVLRPRGARTFQRQYLAQNCCRATSSGQALNG